MWVAILLLLVILYVLSAKCIRRKLGLQEGYCSGCYGMTPCAGCPGCNRGYPKGCHSNQCPFPRWLGGVAYLPGTKFSCYRPCRNRGGCKTGCMTGCPHGCQDAEGCPCRLHTPKGRFGYRYM